MATVAQTLKEEKTSSTNDGFSLLIDKVLLCMA